MTGRTVPESLESRIARRITPDGSVIISPRMARWLEQQSGMTADRRILLRDNDPEAYEVLSALHLAALRSATGTESVAAHHSSAQSEMWMSTSQVAQALHVTDRCVRKWCANGQLPATLTGRRWLIHRTDLTTHHALTA